MGQSNCSCVKQLESNQYEIQVDRKPLNRDNEILKIGNNKMQNYEFNIYRGIIKIQSFLRGWIARKRFSKIKIDAYNTKVDQLLTDFSVKYLQKFSKVSEFKFDKPYPYQDTEEFNFRYFRNPVLLENGAIYIGEWAYDKKFGKGIQVWKDGSIYQGYWIADRACGYGRLVHANGDIYFGEWKNHKSHGYGVYIHKDGSKYEGEWYEDLQHGQGVETWTDGATYKGQYKCGVKDGNGNFLWSDGSCYNGEFSKNDIEGKGIYIWSDLRKYIGTWKSNKMNGRGIFTWTDGRRYIGEYFDDKKDGQGIFEWPDGRKYIGGWKNGKQHGKGIFYTANGQKKKGEWINGERERWVKFEDENDKDQQEIENKFKDLIQQGNKNQSNQTLTDQSILKSKGRSSIKDQQNQIQKNINNENFQQTCQLSNTSLQNDQYSKVNSTINRNSVKNEQYSSIYTKDLNSTIVKQNGTVNELYPRKNQVLSVVNLNNTNKNRQININEQNQDNKKKIQFSNKQTKQLHN